MNSAAPSGVNRGPFITKSDKAEALRKAKELRCAKAPGANVDWSGCEKRNAKLRGANLAGANLFGADLTGADFTGANLERAILRTATLRSANLTGAKLTGADLRSANLRNAKVAGAVFHGAKLGDAVWSNWVKCYDPIIGRDGAVKC